MTASWPSSNRSAARARRALLASLVLLGACTDTVQGASGTTSLRVTIVSPTNTGTKDMRLPDSQKTLMVTLQALDEHGQPDPTFNATVDAYIQFLGTLTPPATKITVSGGQASFPMSLPRAFGATYLWVEDTEGDNPTYATGTSQTLWYRDPFLEDASKPDLTQPSTWLQHSPLEGKQLDISASKHGTNGYLIVTGVYAQGFTLSDVDCTTKPCVADPFNHVFVFTFGRARDTITQRPVEVGDVVTRVSGGIGEFNGFTELNFPQQWLRDSCGAHKDDASCTADTGHSCSWDTEHGCSGPDGQPDLSLVPAPVVIQKAWLQGPTDPAGMLNMEKIESGLAEVDGGVVCPLDSDYSKYQQWKLDIGWGCRTPVNVITAGQVSSFDPAPYVGKTLTRVVGTIKSVNLGSFNVWILLPRTAADITP